MKVERVLLELSCDDAGRGSRLSDTEATLGFVGTMLVGTMFVETMLVLKMFARVISDTMVTPVWLFAGSETPKLLIADAVVLQVLSVVSALFEV